MVITSHPQSMENETGSVLQVGMGVLPTSRQTPDALRTVCPGWQLSLLAGRKGAANIKSTAREAARSGRGVLQTRKPPSPGAFPSRRMLHCRTRRYRRHAGRRGDPPTLSGPPWPVELNPPGRLHGLPPEKCKNIFGSLWKRAAGCGQNHYWNSCKLDFLIARKSIWKEKKKETKSQICRFLSVRFQSIMINDTIKHSFSSQLKTSNATVTSVCNIIPREERQGYIINTPSWSNIKPAVTELGIFEVADSADEDSLYAMKFGEKHASCFWNSSTVCSSDNKWKDKKEYAFRLQYTTGSMQWHCGWPHE